MNKKVAIIGAGVSGLTAGIYLLKAGFDVTIFEKHAIPGGLLTSWVRSGTTIDGCAHWIVGTNERSDFYHVWQDLGVIKEDTKIYQTDYFNILEIDGKTVTFYADIVKLEEELMRVGPEDKKQIKKFIRAIKAYQVINPPADKPVKYFKFKELLAYGAKMLPVLPRILKYYRISVQDFANKFKNPTLRKAFEVIVQPNYNLHSFIYIMQTLTKYDAGVVEGGSKKIANDIYETFKSLGGKVIFNTEVEKIIVDNKNAKSLRLKNGNEVEFDYLIPAQDVHNLLYNNLDGKYMLYKFDKRFESSKEFPLNTGVQVCLKAKPNFNKIEKMYGFETNNIDIGFKKLKVLKVRNHTFDVNLNPNSTLLTVLIDGDENTYEYFKKLRKESEIAYKNEKNRIGELIRKTIIDHFDLSDDELELIDVTTPLTYERYTNAYHGSYMSFLTTKFNRSLMSNGVIKGIKNMFLAGQWLMPPGGLPIALFTGKHAAYRVMRKEKLV